MNTNEFLKKTQVIREYSDIQVQERRPRVYCKDGFSVSIQAGGYLYSTPRFYFADYYDAVECGFPSRTPPASWRKYSEGGYGWEARKRAIGMLWFSLKNKRIRWARRHFRSIFAKDGTDTIYPYIPVWVVDKCLELHGGIDEERTFRDE